MVIVLTWLSNDIFLSNVTPRSRTTSDVFGVYSLLYGRSTAVCLLKLHFARLIVKRFSVYRFSTPAKFDGSRKQFSELLISLKILKSSAYKRHSSTFTMSFIKTLIKIGLTIELCGTLVLKNSILEILISYLYWTAYKFLGY